MPPSRSPRTASPEPQQKSKPQKGDRYAKAILPPGIEPIGDEDYFLKSTEFRRWLRIEKKKVDATSPKFSVSA